MKRLFGLSLAAGAGVALAATALADSHADPALENAVKARNAQMQVISFHTGLLGSMAKGEIPYDAATATAAAKNLSSAAGLERAVLWIEGTEQGTIAGSRAKPDIWDDPAGFDTKATGLITAANAMVEAAGQDLDSLRAAMAGVGTACGDCHKAYRGPRN